MRTSDMPVVTILAPARHHEILQAQLTEDRVATVATLEQLQALPRGIGLLLAFGSGVIVPADVLSRFRRAYNFHGSPPQYPGRDPHHWAVYDGATLYGVTCHRMTAKVDEGEIVRVKWFSVNGRGPQELRAESEKWLLALFAQIAPELERKDLPASEWKWTGKKHSRADLIAMLDLREVDEAEAARRRRAFEGFNFVSRLHQPV